MKSVNLIYFGTTMSVISTLYADFGVVAKGRSDKKDNEIIEVFGKKCNKAFAEFTGKENIAIKGNTPYCNAT